MKFLFVSIKKHTIHIIAVFSLLFTIFCGESIFASSFTKTPPPLDPRLSGGWVLSNGAYRIPNPQRILYRFIGNLEMNMGARFHITNEAMRVLFREAMNILEGLADIHFEETTTDTDNPVHIGRADEMQVTEPQMQRMQMIAYPPRLVHEFPNGAIVLNNYLSDQDWDQDADYIFTYLGIQDDNERRRILLFRTLTHELGHLLGLAHPGHPLNPLLRTANILPAEELDTEPNTIMFPFQEYIVAHGNRDLFFDPSLADRAALVRMYGPSLLMTILSYQCQAALTAFTNHTEL